MGLKCMCVNTNKFKSSNIISCTITLCGSVRTHQIKYILMTGFAKFNARQSFPLLLYYL